jgi:hypothetical protein
MNEKKNINIILPKVEKKYHFYFSENSRGIVGPAISFPDS